MIFDIQSGGWLGRGPWSGQPVFWRLEVELLDVDRGLFRGAVRAFKSATVPLGDLADGVLADHMTTGQPHRRVGRTRRLPRDRAGEDRVVQPVWPEVNFDLPWGQGTCPKEAKENNVKTYAGPNRKPDLIQDARRKLKL